MKQLVLITKNYPFDYGESFLENEIGALAARFERVIVVASAVRDPSTHRPLPSGVEALPLCVSGAALLQGALRSFGWRGSVRSPRDRRRMRRSIKKRLYFAYLCARADTLLRRLKQCVDFQAADETVLYSYWFHDTALAAARLKAELGGKVKAVSRAHGYDLYEFRSPCGYLPAREYMLEQLDAVYPCSAHGRAALAALCPAYRDKLHTAYLGVTDHGEKQAARDRRFTVVSCGYLSPVKRIERIAEAFSKIPNRTRFRWVHFGGGAGLTALRRFADERLEGLSYSFTGTVENREVLRYYQTKPVDLLVNVSISEGLPVSIMEAQMSGVPALATDVGGTSEIVLDGETGFLLPPDCSPEALATQIERVANLPPEEIRALSAAARKHALKRFCAAKNFPDFAQTLYTL